MSSGAERVGGERRRNDLQTRAGDPLALMGLEGAGAREHDTVLADHPEAGDRLTQRPPPAPGEDGEAHHIGKAREVVLRSVEVDMGVEPHYTETLTAAHAGGRTQAAQSVAAQHQRERLVGVSVGHAQRQSTSELEDPGDLRQRFVDGRHPHHVELPARLGQTRTERLVSGQDARPEPHTHVGQACVIGPGDEVEPGHPKNLSATGMP